MPRLWPGILGVSALTALCVVVHLHPLRVRVVHLVPSPPASVVLAMAAVPADEIRANSYVGFDTITQQIEHKLLKRGFQFNIIVVGTCYAPITACCTPLAGVLTPRTCTQVRRVWGSRPSSTLSSRRTSSTRRAVSTRTSPSGRRRRSTPSLMVRTYTPSLQSVAQRAFSHR